ncbi:MAG: DivIVA domain-containing protein [Eubacteriales bacterium]
MDAAEMNKMYEDEAEKYCGGIIDELEHVRFTQKLNGYKDEEVDSFLDKMVNLLNYHKLSKSKNVFLEPAAVRAYVFHEGQMGYNMEQVDEFVEKVAGLLDGINEIKSRYAGE